MGRHAASGSDGLSQGTEPVAAGRRRTDPLGGSLPGALGSLSDHPTAPGRERRRDPRFEAAAGEPVRPMPRSRLPLPPVPAGARRPGVPPPADARPVLAPGTTVAPFQAVPAPEPRAELPGAVGAVDVPAPVPGRVEEQPSAATGRGPVRRTPAPLVPRVPRQTTPSGAPSSSYGDWTKPTRTDDTGRSRLAPDTGPGLLGVPVAPATTAIPERGTAGRNSAADRDGFDGGRAADDSAAGHDPVSDPYDDEPLVDGRPAAVGGPGTGPVKGGRATHRAERQAADAARRKAAKRNGTPDVLFDDEPEGKPRRVLMGLVAMVVVAGAVLGGYTLMQPAPTEATAQVAPPSTPTVAPPSAALPPLELEPLDVDPVVTTPVRVPVTVLNATGIAGLAATISGAVVSGGWESPGVGAYPGTDVPVTTVYFTEGDEQQRQAAVQLVEQFPELAGPAPRFFEVADVPAPGLVIVATGNWQP